MGLKTKSGSKKQSSSPSPSAASTVSTASEASSSRTPVQPNEDVDSASDRDSGSEQEQGDDDGEDEEDDHEEQSELDAESGSDSDAAPAIDLAKARSKLHHIAKTLRATAKKTKAFEVQKLVKKLKGLQKKATFAEQAKLAEAELAALKSIDTSLLAGRALVTKMVKAKLLPRPVELASADEDDYMYLNIVREEELLGADVLTDPVVGSDGDRAAERAKAKVTSSKVLADEVGKFVEELKKIVGIEPSASKTKEQAVQDIKGKGKAKEDDFEQTEMERYCSGSDDNEDSDDEASQRYAAADYDDDGGMDEDEEELERIGKEKLKALGDLSQWDDMIGSDSAPESGSDDESESEEEDERPRKRKLRQASDSDSEGSNDQGDSEDGSDLSDDSDEDPDAATESDNSESDSDPDSDSPPSKKRKKSKSSSTFLPSLNTGFIAGRSDDEWSDAEADLADRDLSELKAGAKKERKNRMGQRARKALYEKKYGKNANHIKMREKKKANQADRPPRRGAVPGNGRQRPPAFEAPKKVDGGWGGPVAPLPKQPKRPFVPRPPPMATPAQAAPVLMASKASAGGASRSTGPSEKSQEMHPSWIAKQKQKELMAQVKPQGKKVVFD